MTNLEALANRRKGMNMRDVQAVHAELVEATIAVAVKRAELEQAIRERRRTGVPISVLARQAGVSRQTVYSILKGEGK